MESFVTHGTRRTHSTPNGREELYPKSYWPGGSDFDHPAESASGLFVRLCLQNKGTLSKAKRALPEFERLSDKEIKGLEEAVSEAFRIVC